MAKILTPLLLAALAGGFGLYREGEADTASGGAAPSKGRSITMLDEKGNPSDRVVIFGEKQRMKKDYGVEDSNVFVQIDFDNGRTIKLLQYAGNLTEVAKGGTDDAKFAQVALDAMGHGLSQKLGDAGAGAESTDDAYESILEVAKRIDGGEWNKAAGEGGGSAKGSSELVKALVIVMGQPIEVIREFMPTLTAAEKTALRRTEPVQKAIEQLRADRKPTDKDAERAKADAAVLAKLQGAVAAVPA